MRRALPASPRRPWFAALSGLAVAAACLLPASRVAAAEAETRVYTISIDGKKAGEYHLTIRKGDDGTVSVVAKSDVRVTVLAVPVYTYSYAGREVWKNGRLECFESSGKEKGKEFSVRADLDGTALKVRANGQERSVRADVWPTSCWQLPGSSFRNAAVPMFGCDTGMEMQGRCDFVAKEEVTVAGQPQTCSHYRVTKDVPHDMWYDAQERLVRDEWVSGGHKTVIEMTQKR